MGSVGIALNTISDELVQATAVQSSGKIDRDRLCSDISSTATVATLVGGFALGNLRYSPGLSQGKGFDLVHYLLSLIAVHGCTCAALMSAFLFQRANGVPDDQVTTWERDNRWLLNVPLGKFVMGCICYLTSVLIQSWRDLENTSWARYISLVIGAMSVMSVFMTATYIYKTSPPVNFHKKEA